MPDADLEQAVDALIGAAYGSAGERCMAISVAVLVGDIADAHRCPLLAERARAAARRQRHAAGRRDGAGHQPRGAGAHRSATSTRASRAARSCWSTAAACERRRRRPREGLLHRRHAVRPRHAADAHLPEEIFGPVLSCVRVPDFAAGAEARQRRTSSATASPATRATATSRASSGAASRSAWSASTCRSRCRWRGTASAAGRRSLFGDTHAYGEEGVRFYTRQKSIMQRWPESTPKGAEFAMPTAK